MTSIIVDPDAPKNIFVDPEMDKLRTSLRQMEKLMKDAIVMAEGDSVDTRDVVLFVAVNVAGLRKVVEKLVDHLSKA